MKSLAFVPVRLTSIRLPKKHLKIIGDRPLLSWVIARLKDCCELDGIVICAPDEPESIDLIDFCKKEGVELYLYGGDVNDVVGRLTSAAKLYDADICVLASGDCPLLSPKSIDKLVRCLKDNPDIGRAIIKSNDDRKVIHEGFGAVRRHVWEKADKYSDTPELREHHFPVLYVYKELFDDIKICEITDDDIYYKLDHRISVDTPSDLEFMNVLYDRLAVLGREFNLSNVISLLLQEPDMMNINAKVHQKTLEDKSFKVCMVVSAVREFGYGNLMRAVDIAISLEDIGVGVGMAVLDDKARELVLKRHLTSLVIEDFDNVLELSNNYDGIVFDLNKDINISVNTVDSLLESGKRVFFIDNIKGGAAKADKVIIPTAHYAGEELPNLVHGPELVVIRREIQRLKNGSMKKDNKILIRVDDELLSGVKKLWPDAYVVNGFSGDFPRYLAESSLAILHLGVSCYEALYLGTMPIVLPRGGEEIPEINRFYSFMLAGEHKRLGDGSARIASMIKGILDGGNGG